MKVVCFGASTSKKSINKQLAHYVGSLLAEAEVDALDLNDFDAPIYSVDKEAEIGIPDVIHVLKEKIRVADGIIISFAEHNGVYTAAFKNVLDWTSRIPTKTWEEKPMFLMATSPGGRGGATVLDIAVAKFPFMGGEVVAQFSLPSFGSNFSTEEGIKDEDLKKSFESEFSKFKKAIGYVE